MDSISNILVQLKNASRTREKGVLHLPYSNFSRDISNALERAGFISVLPLKGKKASKKIEAKLVYEGEAPRLKDARRISKSSKRVYQKSKNLFSVKGGSGNLILSTPKGVLTNREARKEKVGGEVLFEVW